ncbi:hypothetical protein C8R45DRAFT_1124277 [Mycena sanguinolenta]|nr:hypothetical protein C8R45DRAFT_1124277 [Mycena sanguinolenta]
MATDVKWRWTSATEPSHPHTGQTPINSPHLRRDRNNLDSKSALHNAGSLHPVPSPNIGGAPFPERQTIRMPYRTSVSKFHTARSADAQSVSSARPQSVPATGTQESCTSTSPLTETLPVGDECYAIRIPSGLLHPLCSSAEDHYSRFMFEAMKNFTTPYLELFWDKSSPAAGSHEASTSTTIHPDVQAHSSTKAPSRYRDIVSSTAAQYPKSHYRTPPGATPEPFNYEEPSKPAPTTLTPIQRDTCSLRRQILVEIEPTGNTPAACPSVGNLDNNEIREMAKQAQTLAAQSESKTAEVQCRWDGCTERTLLNELPEHLRSAHNVDCRGNEKVGSSAVYMLNLRPTLLDVLLQFAIYWK